MPDGASAVAYSPDGKTILTGSWDGGVRLWDAQTGSVIRQFVGHTEVVEWGVLFADAATYSPEVMISPRRLWDVATGQEVRRFVGHTNAVGNRGLFSGCRLRADGGDDTTARTWDVNYPHHARRPLLAPRP